MVGGYGIPAIPTKWAELYDKVDMAGSPLTKPILLPFQGVGNWCSNEKKRAKNLLLTFILFIFALLFFLSL